ncbi:hypothetical protein RM361_004458 [Enterobacter kobei]|uniref:hypothetical protein n=1 Tax=Enterobacter kobei TaxID=208224 RepID=UPI0022F0F2DA|nr:hypothetical protein [Enterobacter kobei]ELE9225112.1 hypothetical protein [Enterobacter kobei]MDA4610690.1 hypothetical protein [Enterobacter kobei]
MSVKRYEWVACDEHSCHCDVVESAEGDMVDYGDYAALEQKLAESQREFRAADATIENLQMQVEKLAAENGQMLRLLTDISENHDEYVNPDEYLYAGIPMDYVSEINAYVSRDVEAENPFKATDAFLAELRAQGVDLVCDYHKSRCEALRDVDRNGSQRHGAALCDAIDIAYQIRKGVQS